MGQETLEQLAATLPNDLAQYVVEDNEAFQKEIVEEELTSVPALIPVNSSECRHWWGGLFDNPKPMDFEGSTTMTRDKLFEVKFFR